MTFFYILISMITLPALAQIQDKSSCTNVDIRSSNQKIKSNPKLNAHFSKPRDQDSIGWCYGFSSADLLSAELGVPVSAFHASVIYNKKVQKTFFYKMIHHNDSFNQVYEGGLTENALKEIIKGSQICLESDLPFDKKHSGQTYSFIKDLEYIKSETSDADQMCNILPVHFKDHSFKSDVRSVADSLAKENLNQTLFKIVSSHCRDKMITIPKMNVKNESVPSLKNKTKIKNFLSNINSLLNKGKPFEVSYDVQPIMRDGSSGYHSSVVVGRRFKDGKCQYQVRNSWGQSCEPYNLRAVSCDSKTGSYWVNDEVFINMSRNINYIAN